MAQSMAALTQSKFYSPSLNGAIFDGPFKIYFAQNQESLGLSVYFQLQKKLGDLYSQVKKNFKSSGRNIFIMLYPSTSDFHHVFPENKLGLIEGCIKQNSLIGVCTEILGEDFDQLYSVIESQLMNDSPDPLIA